MTLDKEGIRVLGVAESYRAEKSVLSGIVMRGDLRIDGAAFTTVTVGGFDATDGVIDLWKSLDRSDVHLVLLNGCVISWFNVVDLERVRLETGVPVVCVTYEESRGLEEDIRRHFTGEEAERKTEMYHRLGGRTRLALDTGYGVFVRCIGIDEDETLNVLNRFTLEGGKPEPLKVAGVVARATLSVV